MAVTSTMNGFFMSSLYIHIPFCKRKCAYCDFFSVETGASEIPQKEFFAALESELTAQADKFDLRGKKLDTIYFGGGTPSLIEPAYYERFLKIVDKTFSVSPAPEVTIEANPSSLNLAKMKAFKAAGINRISIGAQSFDDASLKLLGRLHDSEAALKAVQDAIATGFGSVSVDIMWGLPKQDIKALKNDLQKTAGTGCQHISAYQLTLEEGFEQRFDALPDEELSREMWLCTHETLAVHGYEHYEISNFAKDKKFISRHNMNYWRYGNWLGLGPNATSMIDRTRLTCHMDMNAYLKKTFEYETESIPEKTAKFEAAFMGLRTFDGLDAAQFEHDFPNVKDKWIKGGLAKISKGRLSLTVDGMLISNELASGLIPKQPL